MASTFVHSGTSWFIGAFSHSLSFSADGKTLAGTTTETSETPSGNQVKFWATGGGESQGTYNDRSVANFSPVESDMVLLSGDSYGTLLKQDTANLALWTEQGNHSSFLLGCYSVDGTRIASTFQGGIFQWDRKFSMTRVIPYSPTISALSYSPNNLLLVGHDDGVLEIQKAEDSAPSSQLPGAGSSKVVVCVWAKNAKWLATGDDYGATRLWNATDTAAISLYNTISPPELLGEPVVSLNFSPDETRLIILGDDHIFVYDIENRNLVSDRAGLPNEAKNIAVDHIRKRAALAKDNYIHLYEIKVQGPQTKAGPINSGNYPAAPTALAQTEITNAVKTIGIPDTWPGLYFDVFQGLWKTKFANGVSVEHRVAIKSFRTAGFNSNLNVATPERDKFEEVLNDCLLKWRGLDHENLAHFLGISMAYGPFPAIITTWMSKGVLTDYIKPENANTHDKLQLVIGIGRGIKYLHEQGIIHSDIRVASCLVNESGEAVLADPGLLNVLKKSPVLARGSTETYPWMAPELFDRPPKDLSQKTDVYAFTMASWEIYSGEEPFAGLQVHEVIFEIQQNSRPEQPSGVKSELWTLWGNGWNKDEGTRPLMTDYVNSLEQI